MTTTITSITVTGLPNCHLLNGQERQKLANQVISDRSAGRVIQTPAGELDRATNPKMIIETTWS